MSSEKSSYLQYLPPALWRDEPDAPEFSLGRFLLPFEKILTGVEDGIPFVRTNYQHESIEHTLDVLHELFNPFKVQSDDPQWVEQWLAYLASSVGLKLLSSWDEHQKRKLIADAVEIYNVRGLKRGLFKYLEIYLVSELSPRIAIDTGESVFRMPLRGEQIGKAQTVASGPPIIHPLSVKVDETSGLYRGQIVIGDHDPEGTNACKLWRMKVNGELEYQVVGGQLGYQPLYDGINLPHIVIGHPLVDGKPIFVPVALANDPAGYFGVADSGVSTSASKILRVSKYPPYLATSVSLVWAGPPMVKAVDMVLNSSGNYVILDRGLFEAGTLFDMTTSAAGMCKILEIDPDNAPSGTPSGAIVGAPLVLPDIIEPAALVIHPDNDYIVADIGDGRHGAGGPTGADGVTTAGTDIFTAASATFFTSGVKVGDTLNIATGNDAPGSPWQILQVVSETELRVATTRADFIGDAGQNWEIYRRAEIYKVSSTTGAATPLLAGLPPERSLPTFPTALLIEDDEHVLILDYGVKARGGTKPLVQPARLWRLAMPIPPAAPSLELVSQDIGFVKPTEMSRDLDGNIIIVDHGESTDTRDWRSPDYPHEFGVILHFEEASPEALRTARAIGDIIRAEKPANTYFTLKR